MEGIRTKEEMEDFYQKQDPWGYFEDTEHERRRLDRTLHVIGWGYRSYNRALDVGCGEGFISRQIPANEVHGMDISETALSRLPPNVTAVNQPIGKYDLVVSTNTMYAQYDYESIYRTIMSAASRFIVIGGISDWLINKDWGRQIHFVVIPYRRENLKISIFEVNTPAFEGNTLIK